MELAKLKAANIKHTEKTNETNEGFFIDERDGKKYKTIKIGNQIWMAENLAYNKYGQAYNYDNSNEIKYGRLYGWSNARKALPNGWKLPSDKEWDILIDYLGGEKIAGGKMKESKIGVWENQNANTNNESGFSALPSGSSDSQPNGDFDNDPTAFFGLGIDSSWWSNTLRNGRYAYSRHLEFDKDSIERSFCDIKYTQISVRCIRDINERKVEEVGQNKIIIKELNPFCDDRDGKQYKTIKIGEQIWMAENLAFKENKGCWAYNDNENFVIEYGYLYSWETAKRVAPDGWHLPGNEEWEILINYLGGTFIAGSKLKEADLIHWQGLKNSENSSRFTGLPGGYRNNRNSKFENSGIEGCFWSSTARNSITAWSHGLNYDTQDIEHNDIDKDNGLSIRCIKNTNENDSLFFTNINGSNIKPITGIKHFGSFMDIRDHKQYKTVKIGKQIWMAENLAFKLNKGSWAYKNNKIYKDEYGYLYNWENAKLAVPFGWHLPSDEEWNELEIFVGLLKEEAKNDFERGCHAIALKIEGSFGFNVKYSGMKFYKNKYCRLGEQASFWSVTAVDSSEVWIRQFNLGGIGVRRYSKDIRDYLSIRCIQNIEDNTDF